MRSSNFAHRSFIVNYKMPKQSKSKNVAKTSCDIQRKYKAKMPKIWWSRISNPRNRDFFLIQACNFKFEVIF